MNPNIVLAIYATTRGFGWVLFEGRHGLIDWGMSEARGNKNRESLARATKLVNWYKPDALILENTVADHSRRGRQIQQLHRDLVELAHRCGIEAAQISRAEIKSAFAARQGTTRYEIAAAIAEEFPALASWMPSPHRIWAAEDRRLSIFDAAALALSFFDRGKTSPLSLGTSA